MNPSPLILGPQPAWLTCPFCHAQVTTTTKTIPNTRTHLLALLCCCLGFFLCCCLFPYCIKSCQSVAHYCPACNAYLGSYNY